MTLSKIFKIIFSVQVYSIDEPTSKSTTICKETRLGCISGISDIEDFDQNERKYVIQEQFLWVTLFIKPKLPALCSYRGCSEITFEQKTFRKYLFFKLRVS